MCLTFIIFLSIYGMDEKFMSQADRHEATLIAIAARVHYEAERAEVPVAIRLPHNGQISSIFSHMGLMEQRLGQIEDRLKRLEIYEKYNEQSQEILYTITKSTKIGSENSRTQDFLFMKAHFDKKS